MLIGRTLLLRPLEGATPHGIGFVLSSLIVDSVGVPAIQRRLNETGLEFVHERSADETMSRFNARFWTKPEIRCTPITICETPEQALRTSINLIKSSLQKTINGGVWSLDQFEGARHHGLGIVLDDWIVDAIGISEIAKRLRVTGLEFSYAPLPVINSDKTMAGFNAVFWVAESKL